MRGLPHSADEIQSEEPIRPGEEFEARSVSEIAVPFHGSQDLKRPRCVEIVIDGGQELLLKIVGDGCRW